MRSVLPIRRFYASLRRTRKWPELPETRLRLVHPPTLGALREMAAARAQLETAGGADAVIAPALRALRRLEARLRRPVRVAVIGEFNSGKSTLANLLVGIESLPTAVISNTCIPTRLYHAAAPEIFALAHDRRRRRLRASTSAVHPHEVLRLEVGLPAARLRAVEILDMPGLADSRLDGAVTDLALHAVDIALWCTLSTQAWKESERAAWHEVQPRLRRRGVLVATHRDLLPADSVGRLMERLHDEAGRSFRDIVPVSTLQALTVARSGHAGDGAGPAWQASGADALETALDDLIDGVRSERLDAALAVTARIAGHALSRITAAAPRHAPDTTAPLPTLT